MPSVSAYVKHRVRKGDTLTKIAKKYGTTWEKIYGFSKNQQFRQQFADPDSIDYVTHDSKRGEVWVLVPVEIEYDENDKTKKLLEFPSPVNKLLSVSSNNKLKVRFESPKKTLFQAEYYVYCPIVGGLLEQKISYSVDIRAAVRLNSAGKLDFARTDSDDGVISITGDSDSIAMDLFGKASASFNFKEILSVGVGTFNLGDIVIGLNRDPGDFGPSVGISKTVSIGSTLYTVDFTHTQGICKLVLNYHVKARNTGLEFGVYEITIKIEVSWLKFITETVRVVAAVAIVAGCVYLAVQTLGGASPLLEPAFAGAAALLVPVAATVSNAP